MVTILGKVIFFYFSKLRILKINITCSVVSLILIKNAIFTIKSGLFNVFYKWYLLILYTYHYLRH